MKKSIVLSITLILIFIFSISFAYADELDDQITNTINDEVTKLYTDALASGEPESIDQVLALEAEGLLTPEQIGKLQEERDNLLLAIREEPDAELSEEDVTTAEREAGLEPEIDEEALLEEIEAEAKEAMKEEERTEEEVPKETAEEEGGLSTGQLGALGGGAAVLFVILMIFTIRRQKEKSKQGSAAGTGTKPAGEMEKGINKIGEQATKNQELGAQAEKQAEEMKDE